MSELYKDLLYAFKEIGELEGDDNLVDMTEGYIADLTKESIESSDETED